MVKVLRNITAIISFVSGFILFLNPVECVTDFKTSEDAEVLKRALNIAHTLNANPNNFTRLKNHMRSHQKIALGKKLSNPQVNRLKLPSSPSILANETSNILHPNKHHRASPMIKNHEDLQEIFSKKADSLTPQDYNVVRGKNLRGVRLLRKGQYNEGMALLLKAGMLGYTHSQYSLAVMFLKKGDYNQAMHWAEKISEKKYSKGIILKKQILEKQLRAYEDSLSKNSLINPCLPSKVPVLYIEDVGKRPQLAPTRYGMEVVDRAKTGFERAIHLEERGYPKIATVLYRYEASRGDPFATLNYGIQLIEKGLIDRGQRWIKIGAEKRNATALLLNKHAEILESTGDNYGAEKVYKRAIQRGSVSGSLMAAYNLAMLKLRQGEHDKAEKVLKSYVPQGVWQGDYNHALLRLRSNPFDLLGLKLLHNANIPQAFQNVWYYKMHLAYKDMGEKDLAQHYLKRAAETGLDVAEYAWGLALKAEGQIEDSENWFERAHNKGYWHATSELINIKENQLNQLTLNTRTPLSH